MGEKQIIIDDGDLEMSEAVEDEVWRLKRPEPVKEEPK